MQKQNSESNRKLCDRCSLKSSGCPMAIALTPEAIILSCMHFKELGMTSAKDIDALFDLIDKNGGLSDEELLDVAEEKLGDSTVNEAVKVLTPASKSKSGTKKKALN